MCLLMSRKLFKKKLNTKVNATIGSQKENDGNLKLNKNCSLFNEFVRKLGLFWPNLHTNELNTTFFCSTSPLKVPNRLKRLKLARRFVLTSCDIYQNPFTWEKILKF
jgi:hypothetical protein